MSAVEVTLTQHCCRACGGTGSLRTPYPQYWLAPCYECDGSGEPALVIARFALPPRSVFRRWLDLGIARRIRATLAKWLLVIHVG